jgi:hypothetical protein
LKSETLVVLSEMAQVRFPLKELKHKQLFIKTPTLL